ncbi:hypothetical protein H0A36_21545 [Endozoicomonas sp. SM1973]|uniref:Uncharacterized protein n=1 Tax=Spartinivicinus marinus TaxID=2994442 RepID=A0A853IEY5_9GAMM|nr:hypothetical protein [Spartinivicinus marinus]MCX4027125.1 hypothetical protein [Spartinivicinus marinus]NYZ68604.1 hypothetical protein [Spartinivicinus marinus]
MSNKFPIKQLKLYKLGEIARSEFIDTFTNSGDLLDKEKRSFFFKLLRSQKQSKKIPQIKKGKHVIKLNAVVWLHFVIPPKQTITFMLVYKDMTGEYGVIIEEVQPGSVTSMMLSNTVELEYIGDIEYMRACCAGIGAGESLTAEGLSVKRVKSAEEIKTDKMA